MSSKLRALTAIFLLCAAIVSLLVSLSITIPHLPTIDLGRTDFDMTASASANLSIAGMSSQGISEIRYGVWSACYYQVNNADFSCVPSTTVGYTFTIQLINADQTSTTVTVTKSWTQLLVVQPLATAVTFLAIPFSIVQCTNKLGMTFSVLALLVDFIALGIDIAFILDLKSKMATLAVTSNTGFKLGFWLWLVAVLFVVLANLCMWGSLRRERYRRLKHAQRLSHLSSK